MKEASSIPELAHILTWKAFDQCQQNKWFHELVFMMGRGGNKKNDSIHEVLEDILRNV